MQNPHFGSKIKIPKNMSKFTLQIIYSCSVQKTAPRSTKYSRNESILKNGHHAKAIAHAKSSLWLKNQNSKNMSKSILQITYSCSVQKVAPKNTKYSRNNTILKIGHHASKGYTPCKILTLIQKLKFQKTCQNPFYKSFTVVLCKNRSKKH